MSDSPTLNDDSELRKKVADILVDAHTHQHWTCMPDCIDHEKSDSPIDQLMQLIHQRDEARDTKAVENFARWCNTKIGAALSIPNELLTAYWNEKEQ